MLLGFGFLRFFAAAFLRGRVGVKDKERLLWSPGKIAPWRRRALVVDFVGLPGKWPGSFFRLSGTLGGGASAYSIGNPLAMGRGWFPGQTLFVVTRIFLCAGRA